VLPEHREQLQVFGRILSRKYIVQLGFHTAFKAIKKIGKGMTACVYNALSFATGREVAIKSFKRSVYFAQDNGNGKVTTLSRRPPSARSSRCSPSALTPASATSKASTRPTTPPTSS
jgi:serine/threonine protein kinase